MIERDTRSGQVRASEPGRLAELFAELRWVVSSWLRPAGSEAGWEQRDRRRWEADSRAAVPSSPRVRQ
jgi:hypothetical protein